MDGLEAVEITYSEINNENRYDSEFFMRDFINIQKHLEGFKCENIGCFSYVTDGEHGSVKFQDNGVKYLTALNIKKGYVDITNINYVDDEVDKRNKRASVNEGDLLISIKGTLGEVAVAESWLIPANMNRDVAIIKINKNSEIYSEYLCVFLMSKYGEVQSKRHGSGGVQQMITLERLRNFTIPLLSKKLQENIRDIYNSHLKYLQSSTALYKQAEDMLLSEIGFKENELNNKNISVKTLSSSFNATGRLDAEYYQPKYDEIIEKIKNYKNGSKKIAELCKLKDSNYLPLSGKEYKYIELSNIGTLGNIIDSTIDFGENLPSRARRQVKSGNIIVSSIEGSLKSCAIINENYNNAICSTGFYVLSSKLINSETLLLLFKSEPVQLILKQNCSGTILTSLNKIDFLNIELPIIDGEIQNNIKELILETNILKQNSEKLLNIAKQAVEMAIEEGELTAIKWIEKNMKDIIKK